MTELGGEVLERHMRALQEIVTFSAGHQYRGLEGASA
jgi:hypothetical protein